MGNTRSTAATPNTELSIPPSEEACQAMTTKSRFDGVACMMCMLRMSNVSRVGLLDKEYWTKSVLRKDTGT